MAEQRYEVQQVAENVFKIIDIATGAVYEWPSGGNLTPEIMAFMTEWLIAQTGSENQTVTSRVEEETTPEALSGMDSFNAYFNSHSPSGFKQTGGWGLLGNKFQFYSPSGWNAPGGWDLNPEASQLYQLQQEGWSRNDAIRIMKGYDPIGQSQPASNQRSNQPPPNVPSHPVKEVLTRPVSIAGIADKSKSAPSSWEGLF